MIINKEKLKAKISLPLDEKIALTEWLIEEWYMHWKGQIYISFSGGKDSTVLLDITRRLYSNIPAVFADTGLEYPEIKKFIRTIPNVVHLRPKKSFHKIIKEYGYPVISKQTSRALRDLQNPTPNNFNIRNLRLTGYTSKGNYAPAWKLAEKWKFLIEAPFKISERCCDFMKKEPLNRYVKESKRMPINAVMADESYMRMRNWLKYGCSIFDATHPISNPMSFWTTQDVLEYIYTRKLPYAIDIYGDIVKTLDNEYVLFGEQRTGCIFCCFGAHLEKEPNRFQRMQITHPKLYTYCMERLGIHEVLSFCNIPH